MEITRTTRLKLDLSLETAQRTVSAWTDACNYISRVAFDAGCVSNAVRLHDLTYAEVRIRFGLSAQVTQNAIRHVAAKYASARTTKKILKQPVVFRQCAVALQGGERGRDFSFTGKGFSVWTLDGRIKAIPFHGEPRLASYFEGWKLGDARLFVRKGQVYLSVSFKREVKAIKKPNDAVVGVDRGIKVLATVTDGKQRQRFFGGGHTNHVRNRYAKVRASLQRKKAQTGSRSVRRVLKRLSGRERRFMRNANHVISRRIVEFAKDTGNPTIAVEDLGGIRNGRKLRKEQRTDLNRWAFYELESFIRYKAESFGMDVIGVDPKHTSQGCSRCGHTEHANRHKLRFLCKACGYELNAELNASRNIRLRGILARQALSQDAAPSCVA